MEEQNIDPQGASKQAAEGGMWQVALRSKNSTVDNLTSFDHGRLLEGSLKSWQAAAEILAVKEVEVEGGQKVAVSFKMGTYPRCCRLSGVL